MTILTKLPARFWAKTLIEDCGHDTPCLTWTAYKLDGYGRFSVGGKIWYAHRVAYEALVGPIPQGLMIDHLCRNRSCVNVEHMEPVTNRVNILRGDTVTAANAAKTHCPQGHEYTPENTHLHGPNGTGRRCRTCVPEQRRARTLRENPDAGIGNAKKTHCSQGHPFDAINTYLDRRGRRTCRICQKEYARRYRERMRGQY